MSRGNGSFSGRKSNAGSLHHGKRSGAYFLAAIVLLAAISAERYDSRKPAPIGHRPSEISVPKMELRTAFVRGSRSPCDWPARPAAMSLSRIAMG
jgi:hypothetical protein